MKMEEKKAGLELNRRDFIKGTAAAAAITAIIRSIIFGPGRQS